MSAVENGAASADQDRVSLARLLLALAALLVLTAPAPADAAKRRCGGTASLTQLRANGAGCATARRIAAESAAIRQDTRRFAAARRCSGDFCIVVSGWRCRPMESAQPRERCTRSRSSIRWLWR